jgi:CheY-like chemotaxis protein
MTIVAVLELEVVVLDYEMPPMTGQRLLNASARVVDCCVPKAQLVTTLA